MLPGIAGFRIREIELSIGAPAAVLGIAFNRELAAELIRVIALDPSQIGVGGGLFFINKGDERRPDSGGIPAAEDVAQTRSGAAHGESADRWKAIVGGIAVKSEGALIELGSIGRLALPDVPDADMQEQSRL